MATQFTVALDIDEHGEDYARQAARETFEELQKLEQELSRFVGFSDISRINDAASGEQVTVGLAAYDCLRLAKAINEETGGAFDVTVGTLMNLWRAPDGSLRMVEDSELEAARKRVGMHLFELDPESPVVTVKDGGISLDLGALGKGYALDQCAEILREWQFTRALLSSGDSTILAIGKPEGKAGWPIGAGPDTREPVHLCDNALSASGFDYQGSHIMDPRTCKPVPMRDTDAWSIAPTAAMADALSTAFTVLNDAEIEAICSRHEELSWISCEES